MRFLFIISCSYMLLLGCAFGLDIFDAIKAGDTNAVRQMVAIKNNLSVVGEYGRTPLMLAAEQGNLDVVKILLRADADINSRL